MAKHIPTPMPTPQQAFLTLPMHREIPLIEASYTEVLRIEHYQGTVDCHCQGCGREAVFQSKAPLLTFRSGHSPGAVRLSVDEYERATRHNQFSPEQQFVVQQLALRDRAFTVEFSCTRNGEHKLFFFFRVHDGTVSKVGQWPSVAALEETGIKKYRGVLGERRFREFSRAVGLHAHAVGIGAFVYLRRIFEGLIDTARQAATGEPGWDETAFGRCRMDEKIQTLKARLPAFLVEHRHMYAILSKGIHELGEEECLDYFEPLKTGIEMILDQEIERRELAAKADRAGAALNAIRQKLGSA
ncbi:MAG: hypothetical protein K2X87_17200 [Gemmataceae bacterium]|nr:hypothetical protein [Gemmataceae bacterium]